MRLDFGFRLANYVTLALACICLAHAEAMYLVGIGWFLPPLLALLATALIVEERWNLPIWAANLLAVLITAGFAAALAYQIHTSPDSFVASVPLPLALVPYAGPELMVLLLIKLFRPKRIADYWQLQAIGLLIVALTCVLGHDPVTGLLLFAYLVSALWCLALFALQRQPRGAGTMASRVPLIPWRAYGIPRAIGWLALVMVGGVLLALVTPRLGSSQWNPLEMLGQSPPGRRAETGVPMGIDLNRTGQIEVDEEVVMEIQARDRNNQPKTDLNLEQRWRGMFLDQYDHGRWRFAQQPQMTGLPGGEFGRPLPAGGAMAQVSKQMMRNKLEAQEAKKAGIEPPRDPIPNEYFEPAGSPSAPRTPRVAAGRLPDLGHDEYFLTFTLQPRKAGGFFLADPVWTLPEHPSLPVVPMETSPSAGNLFAESHGGITHMSPPRGQFQYRQVTIPHDEPDLGPPVELDRVYQRLLTIPPPASLVAWTDDLLQRLLAKPGVGLRPDDLTMLRDGDARLMHPAKREKVARALCNHLKQSGEYTYTLDLKRQDYELDPTEDFLRNVKQGHCERYSGALALMLRAEGIPARIVKGFRGCESLGDGQYQVRNSQAHVWVEALVSRPGANGRSHLHWLALDPVALEEAPAAPPFSLSRWWQDSQQRTSELWRVFVVDYGADEQEALASEVWSAVSLGNTSANAGRFLNRAGVAAGLIVGLSTVGIGGIWLLRRAHRRRSAPAAILAPSVRFYARLLDLLAVYVYLRPAPAQTPREFGAAAAHRLHAVPATASLAALPEQVVSLFYRVRYGSKTISEAERRVIDERLDALAMALAAARQVATPSSAA
jgi:transglutaminase-like putative cysteine protease